MFCWFKYTDWTADYRPETLDHNWGAPSHSEYTFLVLTLLIVFFFRKLLFLRDISRTVIIARILAIILLVISLIYFVETINFRTV